MKRRWNGSVQSGNTPTWNQTGIGRDDYRLYRCMVIKVLYTDDAMNFTKNSQNPEVLYEVIILGGHEQGQILSNARCASWLGGNSNYSETTLKATTKELSKVSLSKHDGDIVMVQFIQGHDAYPMIIGAGKGLSNKVAASKTVGPRDISEYNGLIQEINRKGEFKVSRKGGSVDASGIFNSNAAIEAYFTLGENELVELGTKSTGKVKIANNKLAIGANGVELFQKIVDALTKIIGFLNTTDSQHTHLGNLGYPTLKPIEETQFTALANDLATIKSALDSIKGSL